MLERAHVFYSGVVQGVYFRGTAQEIARRYSVSGWVRNLPDGRVEMVAEGEPGDIQSLLEGIREAKRRNITEEDIRREDATGEFGGFSIVAE
ncbi:MAG: acylphosphatase [Planctomycetaceae bacterium]|nr:acylphosphatase [Planctomycetaceae bacterium]